MNNFPSFVAPLGDLAVIEIAGADSASFLHGQLTHDVASLTPDQARLAGYCTAKGRLLGSMVVWQGSQGGDTPALYALVKADIAQALIKRLSMFVLRAKATLQLSQLSVLGVAVDTSYTENQAAPPAGQSPGDALISEAAVLSAQAQAWSVVRTGTGNWIAAPSADSNIARWWLITDMPGNPAVESALANPDASQACQRWQAGDIAAGLPWIQAATQDLFIPQTLNLDLIDGVSFTKGCYPGQEVVARSHYRGTVKRRMAYGVVNGADIAVDALAGTDIYRASNEDPCGRIVNAALCGGIHTLMEVQLADLDQDSAGLNTPGADPLRASIFRLGGADGPAIDLLALPYQIASREI